MSSLIPRLTTADLETAQRVCAAYWLEHRHNSVAQYWNIYDSIERLAHNLPAFLWYSRGGDVQEYHNGEWRDVKRQPEEFELWTIEYPLRPKEAKHVDSDATIGTRHCDRTPGNGSAGASHASG